MDGQNFKINDSTDSPINLDYDILGLHKKRTITQGELRLVEYYKEYNPSGGTFSNLVLQEYRDYTRDAFGLVQYRTQTTHWLLDDGTTGATKQTTKYYSPTESIAEGITRRTNIIDEAKIYCLGSIGRDYGFDLLTTYKFETQLYIDGHRTPLINAISATTKPYMGTKQKEGVTATTITDPGMSQTDTITINGAAVSYTSSATPTIEEIASGLVAAITASTNVSISSYVTAALGVGPGTIEITSKIPGIAFTIAVSTNLTVSNITANNGTVKQNLINILTF